MTASEAPGSHLEAALGYADSGWHVFPLGSGTKGRDRNGRSTHLLTNGHKGASNDPERVLDWWTRWPDANIGLHLAASGLVALDPDLYKPECQWDRFIRGRELPETLVQSSPRGGKHFIFRARPGDRFPGTLCPGVEIKHKGYILLEPSTFQGSSYRFDNDDEPAPAPDWLASRETPPFIGATVQASGGVTSLDFGTATPGPAAGVPEVENLLLWLDPDIAGYDAWVEVLQALHHHFGGSAEGLEIAESWSRRGERFRVGEVAEKWRGFRVGGGVTLASVALRARNNGADLAEIAERHRQDGNLAGAARCAPDGPPDLSHDHLALDLGRRSWDADARHVAHWGKWLFWTGTHWQRDETLDHLSRVRSFLRTRATEFVDWADRRATRAEAGDGVRAAHREAKSAREQAKTLRSNATVVAVTNLARSNPASAVAHEAFDADMFLIGTPGGTVDLRSGILRPSRRADMISRLVACVPADHGGRPDVWLRFLSEIFDGDFATIGFIQRAAGYALTGSVEEHKLLFFHGAGRNGKSVLLNTLLELWGDYGRRVAATTFLNSRSQRHPTDIAGLQGARLAIASELPRGKTWDEAVIKDLTGGDRMTARFMRQDFFDFDPQLTLMIAGNTQPSFRGVDEAIRARVVLVPFPVTIPASQRDRSLPNTLKAEAPAILRWCIDGALAWKDRGLDVPPSIAAASRSYFDEEDTLGQFLLDETLSDPQAIAATDDLIQRFGQWCLLQGLDSWTKRTLVKELKTRGFADARSNGRRGLRGLRLK